MLHTCTHHDTPAAAEALPDLPPRRRFMRQFTQLAALAGGVSLLAATPAKAAGKTEAVLLSCMDFRLMDEIDRYMSGRGLRDNYDHLILAGASLGVLADKYPAWGQTFWSHLGLAIELHQVQTAIIMDHRDCGAYKTLLGPEHSKTVEAETQAHAQNLHKLKAQINQRHPSLKVETLLMALDGKVQAV